MNMLRLAFLLVTAAAPAWGAISYSRFAHPKGDYLLEFPSDWRRSAGMEALWLRPPDREGSDVKIGLRLHPTFKSDAATPKDFIASLLSAVGEIKKLDSRSESTVAGRKAERLALTETEEYKDDFGQKLPGPMREGEHGPRQQC